ncbi:hypothetical protein B0T10DRAFT_69847 [Thelonectria olida]|uniref:Uncharacterized protein n=1 Tax=Thelonectria olida TaxID=1576542 RepID=A0A9P9ARU2_9HYPO|nr:hypothetical protein B0T10DRAFT_69847 [Thelonectria olida]
MDHHNFNSSNHPSQSIPDAAYPDDSPYQPGHGSSGSPFGGSAPHDAITPVSSHQTYTPSHSKSPYEYPGLPPSDSSHQPASAGSSSAPWEPSDPRAQIIPSVPPPPYDPTRVPAAYSPLGGNSSNVTLSQSQSQSHPVFHEPRVEGASTQPSIELEYLRPSHPSPSLHPSQTAIAPPTPVSEVGSHKLGPMVEAQQRRRRKNQKWKICAVISIALILFIIGMTIGLKVALRRNDDDDDDRGPPHSIDD